MVIHGLSVNFPCFFPGPSPFGNRRGPPHGGLLRGAPGRAGGQLRLHSGGHLGVLQRLQRGLGAFQTVMENRVEKVEMTGKYETCFEGFMNIWRLEMRHIVESKFERENAVYSAFFSY